MSQRVVRFDNYEVDFARRELRKRGIRIGLQQKPFRVLELLLRRPGELVSRKELIGFLWPDSHVSFAHGLNTAVNSLRQALGESSRKALFIETRPGLGYRFNAEVHEIQSLKWSSPSADGNRNQNAYEDCLKGRYLLERKTPEETQKAIAFFRSAVAEESCAALGNAGLAEAYCQLAQLGSMSSMDLERKSRSAVDSALKLDPDLAQAHVSAGLVKMVFEWDWKGAEEAVDRAFSIDPASVSAHCLSASLLVTLGHFEEALQVARKAVSIDPLSFAAELQLAACLYATRDFKGTVENCWNMLNLASPFAPAQLQLASAYEQLGMYEEASIEYQNASLCPGFEITANFGLAHVLAITDLEVEAAKVLDGISAQVGSSNATWYGQALLSAARGQRDRTISLLNACVRERSPSMLRFSADPRFDIIRGEEDLQAILCPLMGQSNSALCS